MTLRVTNQHIEALAPGDDGVLRVTSQCVEVLAIPEVDLDQVIESSLAFTTESIVATEAILEESLESEITLGSLPLYIGPKSFDIATAIEFEDVARIPATYEVEAASTLTFTQIIGLYGSIHYDLASTLTLSQVTDLTEKNRDAANELEFTSVASADYLKILGSVLELEDAVTKGLTVIDVQHQLTFVQDARLNPRSFEIEQQIVLTQTIRNSVISIHVDNELEFDTDIVVIQPWLVAAESVLQVTTIEEYDEDGNPILIVTGLQDLATLEQTLARSVTSPVWLSQDGSKVLIKVGSVDLDANSSLAFNSEVPACIYLDANNTLDFIDYADNRHEFPATVLEIESDVTYNINYAPRQASSTLGLISSFFVEKDDLSLCEYNPFLGSTTDPDAPQQYLKNTPVIDPNATGVTLFYPWTSPTTTVNLRGPDLGNRTRLEFQRIKRETRGGTLIVWADPIWPKNEHLALSFSGLTEVEGQAVLDFIYLTLGKEIGIIDWEGNTQRAITVTPSEPLVRNSRCNLSINLEFEISRSVLKGRASNDINFNSIVSQQSIRNRAMETPTWLIQALTREASFARPETSEAEFIQTLGRQISVSQLASNEIDFTTAAEQQTVFDRGETSEIDFTTAAEQHVIFDRDGTSELDFTQACISSLKILSGINEIDFTQASSRQLVFNRAITSEIEYIPEAISSIKSLGSGTEIEFTEASISSIKSLISEDELAMTTTADSEII